MQHFHVGNRHQIKDAPPNTWATVHCRDVVTMSELARRGFHLVDMSGEVWTMHREGSSLDRRPSPAVTRKWRRNPL